MEDNFDINNELKESAPFLSQLDKKEKGYKVPFNYFEVLPDQIMKQLEPEAETVVSPSSNQRISLLDWLTALLQPRYALALAAMVGALFLGSIFLNNDTNTENNDILAALESNISSEDARIYVQENLDEFALELLSEDTDIELDYNSVFDLNDAELLQFIEDEVLEEFEESDLL